MALDLKGRLCSYSSRIRTNGHDQGFGSGARPVGESVDGIMEIIESGYSGKTDSGTFWHGNYGNGIQEHLRSSCDFKKYFNFSFF